MLYGVSPMRGTNFPSFITYNLSWYNRGSSSPKELFMEGNMPIWLLIALCVFILAVFGGVVYGAYRYLRHKYYFDWDAYDAGLRGGHWMNPNMPVTMLEAILSKKDKIAIGIMTKNGAHYFVRDMYRLYIFFPEGDGLYTRFIHEGAPEIFYSIRTSGKKDLRTIPWFKQHIFSIRTMLKVKPMDQKKVYELLKEVVDWNGR